MPRSSAATGSPSPAPTGPTPPSPTRTCSPPRSTASSPASRSQDEHVDEVVAGAVLKHARDFNLTRESVLGSALASTTPAYDIQQACDTGIEADRAGGQQDRARADRVRHRRRRRHDQRRAGRPQRGPAPGADGGAPREDARRSGSSWSASCGRSRSCPTSRATPSRAPACRWASTPRSPPRSGASRARSRTSWPPPATRSSPPPTTAASSTTSSRRTRASSATRTCGRTRRAEKLAKLKPVFGNGDGTMTAGNSTPLSDGAAVVLLASDEWANERSLPVLAHLTHVADRRGRLRRRRRRAADGAGLRGAEAARQGRPDAAGLRLLRDPRGVRLAGAGDAGGVGERERASARSTATSSTSPAARSRSGTRSPPPAGGSSPRWPSCWTRRARAAG